MKTFKFVFGALSLFFAASNTVAQNLTAEQKTDIVQHASSLYYSPTEHGFLSMACDIKLNWDTVPKAMLLPAELAGREPLESTQLRFIMGATGKPEMTREYAKDTPALMKPVYDKFFDWASNVVTGFFMTWGSKSLRSPIPTGHYIASLAADQGGYKLSSNSGEVLIALSLSKDFVITGILTTAPGQTIDEHPRYTPSAQGLVLTGDDATNKTADGATHVSYEVDYRPTDTIIFPDKVHLVVDKNIDMRFALENCSVERGTVIKVRPSKP